MTVHRVHALRQQPNPVRVPTWNVSIRAGDDFKLALTVHEDDGTLAQARGSRSRLALCGDQVRGYSHDYGAGWTTYRGRAEQTATGYPVDGQPGRINFVLPSATTAALCGRYRFWIQVDLADGVFSEIEGIVQVRGAADGSLGHAAISFFQLDRSQLDGNEPLADALATNGLPVDADGFFLMSDDFLPGIEPVSDGSSSVLGVGVLGLMILAG